ncbi:molybdopterin-dependent oxidoreductase [Halomarina pelagica]|uniref:molybdopterin-dependent oxidoreductase n=1 Tax=Halomarina pelagica TaxID=2961599 RepID=UPI0020C2D430|nr:molybdopterin-dependent oxidoreductase [Halomarina sp. BND7]
MSGDACEERGERGEPIESPRLDVIGRERLCLSVAALRSLPSVERRCTVACASGRRTTARWRGVPVPELLDRASMPEATTHLVIGSDDGYRACVAVRDALDGIVAYARDGTQIWDERPYATRFVAPGIEGARTVRGPTRIEGVALAPGADPDAYEARPAPPGDHSSPRVD